MSDEPFLPLARPEIDEQTIRGVADVLRSGELTTGRVAAEFEAALSELFRGRTVRVFNSGAVTIEVALRLLGIDEGHEVVTTPLAWAATANAVLKVGARPVFVDIDPTTRHIDCARIEAAITPRTRAIVPVHLGGAPCDLDSIHAIAHVHGLRVVEDASHAIDASWRGRRIGSFGDYASFSFHASQNITSIEGGCLVMPADADVGQAETLRVQGVTRGVLDGMDVDVVGATSYLTDVAARVGLGQLPRLAGFTARRRALAQRYFEAFDAIGALDQDVQMPVRDLEGPNWHLFQIVLPPAVPRPAFMQELRERGIATGVHYPAMHLFTLYRRLGWKEGDFPHAERIGRSIVSLPLFPSMDDADVERVVEAVDDALHRLV
ncbi:MAG: DegT/DnrJ/EryC1/StrS family aminotransferase [Betaproteobacteria bacterium]